MRLPAKYDFLPRIKGDNFLGIKFQLFDGADQPVDISGSSVRMQLRKSYGFPLDLQWSTVENTIEVNVNEIYIKERTSIDMDIDAYKYRYDVEVTYPDGVTTTLIKGLFPLENDVTR